MAEWIEGCKRAGWHLQKALYNLDDDRKVGDWAYDENDDLVSEKVDIFARAWLDGYTVEKEKLYEKLGVLLVDMPEPWLFLYTYIVEVKMFGKPAYTTNESDDWEDVIDVAYKCTQEEAKKYPQFRWVALEEL